MGKENVIILSDKIKEKNITRVKSQVNKQSIFMEEKKLLNLGYYESYVLLKHLIKYLDDLKEYLFFDIKDYPETAESSIYQFEHESNGIAKLIQKIFFKFKENDTIKTIRLHLGSTEQEYCLKALENYINLENDYNINITSYKEKTRYEKANLYLYKTFLDIYNERENKLTRFNCKNRNIKDERDSAFFNYINSLLLSKRSSNEFLLNQYKEKYHNEFFNNILMIQEYSDSEYIWDYIYIKPNNLNSFFNKIKDNTDYETLYIDANNINSNHLYGNGWRIKIKHLSYEDYMRSIDLYKRSNGNTLNYKEATILYFTNKIKSHLVDDSNINIKILSKEEALMQKLEHNTLNDILENSINDVLNNFHDNKDIIHTQKVQNILSALTRKIEFLNY